MKRHSRELATTHRGWGGVIASRQTAAVPGGTTTAEFAVILYLQKRTG